MIKVSKQEATFWLDVAKGALKRTRAEIKTLKDKKTKFFSQGFLLDKKAVFEKLTGQRRKTLLAERRASETELVDRVNLWESVLADMQ